MNNLVIKLRIILWLTLFFIVSLLLCLAIVPQGHIIYSSNFVQKNFFIGELFPHDRVEFIIDKDKNKRAAIVGEPVYFSLYTPHRFNKARLTLIYRCKNQEINTTPIIEAGVLMDKKIWRYDLKPLDNIIIDEFVNNWNVVRENDLLLLQRPISYGSSTRKLYKSISEFLNNLPPREQIALYNYNLDVDYILPNYQKQEKIKTIDYALRGAYQFYTYIKDEPLDFDFVFEDINQNKDPDPIDINLYYRNQLISQKHLDDDGITNDNKQITSKRNLHLLVKNLPEGVYKIELKVNDDIVTKNIKTTQQKISFINNLHLAQDGRKNFLIYTDSPIIYFKTTHPFSLQTVMAGDKILKINETYKQFSMVVSTSSIKIEKDGIIMGGEGVFAFSQDNLINPNFTKVNKNFILKQKKINYILAKYKKPSTRDGWKQSEVEFDISHAYRENYKYNFLISIPELRADDNIDDKLLIKEVKVYLLD